KLVPNCCHVSHPGYFGFITPTPLPVGILADTLCSTLNQNVGTYSVGPGAVALEKQTVRWLADLIGYGKNAGGHLTSGGTLANFEGLKLARDWASGDTAQHEGVNGRMAAYVSEERHISLDKAADAIGIGRNNLRHIPTDDQFRVKPDLLEAAINTDREKGIKPICLIGLAGTTNTGAIDNLSELRKIADREKLWFHIDAAYGGGLLLSPKWRNLLDGIQTADSVTIDPHKWFFAPLDAGAILVKDQSRLESSYGMQPPYLKDETDTENKRFQYYANSFEQSRRFRSLKVWMSFKHYGAEQIGEWVDNNVEQAQQLHRLCQNRPDFVSAAEPQMSGVCIRYHSDRLNQAQLDKLHVEVSRKVEETGKFWITTTRLKDKTWFRINIVNFRTRLEHMQQLSSHLEETCRQVHKSYKKEL
ncbi:MAG: pyridoxal-dependent decarboxylase, partial [candidate division Zixibacteria bacterium]|nr:pyridoxal-dependent decarboxylase [candidate division Zixibacteria bacterium]